MTAKELAFAYPILYNYAYIGVEAVITLILINLPPVKKALATIRNIFMDQPTQGPMLSSASIEKEKHHGQ